MFRLRHSGIKILGPRGGKVAFQVREAASVAGVELRPVLEILCTLGQGRGDRECRGWLQRRGSHPCLFSAVWSAMVVVRSGVSCGVWRGVLDA